MLEPELELLAFDKDILAPLFVAVTPVAAEIALIALVTLARSVASTPEVVIAPVATPLIVIVPVSPAAPT